MVLPSGLTWPAVPPLEPPARPALTHRVVAWMSGRRVAARSRDCGDTCGVRSHRHYFNVGRTNRTMFTIDQDPIEAGIAQHLHELRRREHQRDPEGDSPRR